MVTWIAKVDLGVKSFPLVDQRLRMALVVTVSSRSTEPVGGGNTAVAMGILSRGLRAKIFWVVVVEFAVGLFAPRTPAAASGAGSGGA